MLNFIKIIKVNSTSINMHISEIVIEAKEPKYKPRFIRIAGATIIIIIAESISPNAKNGILHFNAIKCLTMDDE